MPIGAIDPITGKPLEQVPQAQDEEPETSAAPAVSLDTDADAGAPEPVATTTTPTTVWKPDFTKTNPYEGAPPEYLEQVKGTTAYTAAVEKGWIAETDGVAVPVTLPPATEIPTEQAPVEVPAVITGTVDESQLSPGTIAAKSTDPELAALVDSGASIKELYDTASRMPGAYAAGIRDAAAEQLRVAQDLTGEAQFQAYEKLGYIPEGSEYIDAGEGKWQYIPPTTAEVQYEVPRQVVLGKDALTLLQETHPDVYEMMQTEGLTVAYQKHGNIIAEVQWAASHPTLATGYREGGREGAEAAAKGYSAIYYKRQPEEELLSVVENYGEDSTRYNNLVSSAIRDYLRSGDLNQSILSQMRIVIYDPLSKDAQREVRDTGGTFPRTARWDPTANTLFMPVRNIGADFTDEGLRGSLHFRRIFLEELAHGINDISGVNKLDYYARIFGTEEWDAMSPAERLEANREQVREELRAAYRQAKVDPDVLNNVGVLAERAFGDEFRPLSRSEWDEINQEAAEDVGWTEALVEIDWNKVDRGGYTKEYESVVEDAGDVPDTLVLQVGGYEATVQEYNTALDLIQTKYDSDPLAAIEGGDIDAVRTLYGDEQTVVLQEMVIERRAGEPSTLSDEFQATHVEPGAGDQWLTTESYNRLTPRAQAAYDRGGYVALTGFLKSTDQRLADYSTDKQIPGHPLGHTEKVYDIAGFMRDNPDDDWVLRTAGFSAEDIASAKAYAEQPSVRHNAVSDFVTAVSETEDGLFWINNLTDAESALRAVQTDTRGVITDPQTLTLARNYAALLEAHPGVQRLREKAYATYSPEFDEAPQSLGAFTAQYLAARGIPITHLPDNDPDFLEQRAALRAAQMEYDRLYGTAGASQLVDLSAILFPPARAAHPEVELADIGALEWALGAANVALIAVAPALGITKSALARVAAKGVEAAATGTYAAVLAIDWKNMSPAERLINTVLTTAIAGAVVGRPLARAAGRIARNPGVVRRIEALGEAVRRGRSEDIVVAADRLLAYGRAMKRAGAPGADVVITQAEGLRNTASKGILRTTREMSDDFISLRRQLIDFSRRVYAEERGAMRLETAATTRERLGVQETRIERMRQAATFPITRAEAEALGLTLDELDDIFRQAGTNRELFMRLAQELSARKAKTRPLRENPTTDEWMENIERLIREERAKKAVVETGDPLAPRRAAEAETFPDIDILRIHLKPKPVAPSPEPVTIVREEVIPKILPEPTPVPVPMPEPLTEVVTEVEAEPVPVTVIEPTPAGVPEPAPLEMPAPAPEPTSVPEPTPIGVRVPAPEPISFPEERELVIGVAEPMITPEEETLAGFRLTPAQREKLRRLAATRSAEVTVTGVRVAPAEAVDEETALEEEPAEETAIEEATALEEEIKVAEEEETALVDETVVEEEPVVDEPTKEKEPIKGEKEPKRYPVRIRLPSGATGYLRTVAPGSIAWKQGLFWKYIPPPYNQPKPITLPRDTIPKGARDTGSNRPTETIQVIGQAKAPVPRKVSVDLGWTDVFVYNGRTIEFRAGGLATDVGEGVYGPTQGMSIGGSAALLPGSTETRDTKPRPNSKSQSKKTNRKRPRRRRDDFSDVTGLQGMRF